MKSTMHHMYQKSSFNSTNKERIELTGNGNSLIIEMANIKINVQDGRCLNFSNNLLKTYIQDLIMKISLVLVLSHLQKP